MGNVALEVAGISLDLDEVLIHDAVKWNLKKVSDELAEIAESAGDLDVDELRALTRRLDSLAEVYERGAA